MLEGLQGTESDLISSKTLRGTRRNIIDEVIIGISHTWCDLHVSAGREAISGSWKGEGPSPRPSPGAEGAPFLARESASWFFLLSA